MPFLGGVAIDVDIDLDGHQRGQGVHDFRITEGRTGQHVAGPSPVGGEVEHRATAFAAGGCESGLETVDEWDLARRSTATGPNQAGAPGDESLQLAAVEPRFELLTKTLSIKHKLNDKTSIYS